MKKEKEAKESLEYLLNQEGEPICAGIDEFLQGAEWSGTATELSEGLNQGKAESAVTPLTVTRRLKANIKQIRLTYNIEVSYGRNHRGRFIKLTRHEDSKPQKESEAPQLAEIDVPQARRRQIDIGEVAREWVNIRLESVEEDENIPEEEQGEVIRIKVGAYEIEAGTKYPPARLAELLLELGGKMR
jgi:hypothetical protein